MYSYYTHHIGYYAARLSSHTHRETQPHTRRIHIDRQTDRQSDSQTELLRHLRVVPPQPHPGDECLRLHHRRHSHRVAQAAAQGAWTTEIQHNIMYMCRKKVKNKYTPSAYCNSTVERAQNMIQ